MTGRTNRVDHDQPEANMYGVVPCPKCGGRFRWPTQSSHPRYPDSIVCDDCGAVEVRDDMPDPRAPELGGEG